MLGFGPGDPFPTSILALTPPAERFSVEEAARRHVAEGSPFDVIFPVRHRNGENRWVRSRGRCERNEQGVPTHFSGSIQDITPQLAARAALVAATEEASAANRAKSDFLAKMSHEIRTPMNGVLGMTELLLDTALNPVQREYAETIRTSATLLLGIINDILDFSKIEAGRMEVESIEMDVRDCVEDVGTVMACRPPRAIWNSPSTWIRRRRKRARGPAPPAPDPDQSRRQCPEVHRSRRGGHRSPQRSVPAATGCSCTLKCATPAPA